MNGQTRHLLPAALAVTLLAALGCDSGGDGTAGQGFEVRTGNAADAAASAGETSAALGSAVGAAGTLAPGLYASRQLLLNLAAFPLSPDPVESETISILLHDVRLEGDRLVASHEACEVRQSPINGVQTVFSKALIAAIPLSESVITVAGPAEGPWQVSVAEDIKLLGVKLTDPSGEALPTEADDPRVLDSDGDGHPGVTVLLTGLLTAETYVVQRNRGGLTGTMGADGVLQGTVDGDIEQVVVGASHEALKDLQPEPSKHPDPEKSRFVWRKVAEGSTCADILDSETTIFSD